MYICICQGITEDQLKSAASHSTSQREVLKRLGVGEGCGTCLLSALDCLDIHHIPSQSKNSGPARQKSDSKNKMAK